MDAYMYRAAFYCADCGKELCTETAKPEGMDLENESTWDSDDYPKGPYPNGGGEADTPQHCDACGVFLENSLTDDGRDYVREAVEEGHELVASKRRLHVTWRNPVVKEWSEFYGIKPGEE